MPKTTVRPKTRKADQYDDPQYNYLKYWNGRDYENAAEEMAIRRLLGRRHFKHAVDIGGGYGRLCVLLEKYADKVTLAEPSRQQLDLAKKYLKGHPEIEQQQMQASDLKFDDEAVDLVTIIRVLHHLPDPTAEFAEIARVLEPKGYAIIEMANYTHIRNRLKYMVKGQRLPLKPVDLRSAEKQADKNGIPFVNHNPRTVERQLAHAGLHVVRTLSVSNLRSQQLKKLLPHNAMLAAEWLLQPTVSWLCFGPSIFYLVRKSK